MIGVSNQGTCSGASSTGQSAEAGGAGGGRCTDGDVSPFGVDLFCYAVQARVLDRAVSTIDCSNARNSSALEREQEGVGTDR